MKWILPAKTDLNVFEQLLSSRNVQDKEKYFNSSLKDLYDPFLIGGMAEAVSAISKAIKEKKKIFIHGDFDVDGISATSILWQFLYRDLNANVIPYVPNRFTEGYGLSDESINAIIEQGGEIIITVDCGVKDIELISKYSEKIDFIITDHHTVREFDQDNPIPDSKHIRNFITSSKAKAVVHPQLGDYPFTEICGASVAWKLCSALNTSLNTGVDIDKYLDLACLGTICDVMPLVDENRIIVKYGLKRLKKTQNIGLKTMIDYLKLDPQSIDTYHIGFMIGPRLNASGRMKSAMDAVRLLTTQDSKFALEIVKKLDELNTERQTLTQKYFELAEEQLKNNLDKKLLFVYGEEWPEGILGLIAGKLTEKYSRPAIAASINGEKVKGSARSIEEFHIANNLKSISQQLLAFGGHAQAAGLSFQKQNLSNVKDLLEGIAANLLRDTVLEKKVHIDAIMNSKDLNYKLTDYINNFAPFGLSNSRPNFAFLGLKIKRFFPVGKENKHLKLFLSDETTELEAIYFNSFAKFNEMIKDHSTLPSFDVAASLDVNVWNGNKKIVLKVEDMRMAI